MPQDGACPDDRTTIASSMNPSSQVKTWRSPTRCAAARSRPSSRFRLQSRRGESYGIVGESGCGKSTVAWAMVNFLGANGYVKHGSIRFMGEELMGK